MKGKELQLYKNGLVLSKVQRELLVGCLLGDASIPRQKLKHSMYSVKFEQKIANLPYIEHLYNIFKDWVGTPPAVRNIFDSGVLARKSVWFRTYRHKSFKYYYNQFYKDGKKSVPRLIHRMLTPRVIAYWFMDDGTKQRFGYHLSTQGFNLKDNRLLVNALNTKYFLDCRVHRDDEHFRIYIPVNSIVKFNTLIKPYILPIMQYKLHNKG